MNKVEAMNKIEAADGFPFHLFADHLNDVFYVVDLRTGKHEYVSPAFETVYGRPLSAIYEDPYAWLEAVHPEDRPRIEASARKQYGTTGRLVTDAPVYRVIRPDGSIRWIRSRKFLVENTTLMAGIAQDITDLMQAQESLRAKERHLQHVVEISPVMLFTLDASNGLPAGVTYISANVRHIMGYEPSDFERADFWNERMHPEDAQRVFEGLKQALHKESHSSEYRFRHADGTWRWMHDELRRVRDAQGRVVEFIGCWRDITESVQAQKLREQQRLAELALQEVEGQLHHAQKMESLGRLAGGIAHDFNNLLTIITWYSEFLLARNDEVNAVRPELEEIHRAAERAAALTRKLTAFSRRQVLSPRVVSLKDVVSEALAMLGRLLGENVEIATRFENDLPYVLADPGPLEQVLVNLAINARDAMPNGGRISIETVFVEIMDGRDSLPPGRYARLTFADTGVGMDETVRPHIFEPFFTTKPEGVGTGLGLSTVYGIVQQSDGHIRVASAPGVGTRFDIYFPAALDMLSQEDDPARGRAPDGSGEKVLIVDDDESIRTLACNILEGYGYSVRAAVNGEEALDLARESRPDLLLTDIGMPGMNGRELATRLWDENIGMRVMFMTGYAEETLQPGDDRRLLQKPFSSNSLAHAVRAALDG